MRPLDVAVLVLVVVSIMAFAYWHASRTDAIVRDMMQMEAVLRDSD